MPKRNPRRTVLLISQFVTNQICSHVTDLLSFVSLAFLYNPADFLPDYLFHCKYVIIRICFFDFYSGTISLKIRRYSIHYE